MSRRTAGVPVPGGRQARPWVARLEAVALVVTVGSVVLAAFSLFAWVRYDTHALPAVLRGVDFVAVSFSVFMFTSLLAPWVVAAWAIPGLVDRPDRARVVRLALGALAVVFIAFPLAIGIGVVVLSALYLAGRAVGAVLPRPVRRVCRRLYRGLGAAVVVGVVLATPNYGTPTWAPLERVDTGDASYVGWVLESGDHDLALLEEGSRDPVLLRQDAVVKRAYCDLDGDGRPRPAHPLSLLGWELFDDVPDLWPGWSNCHAEPADPRPVRAG